MERRKYQRKTFPEKINFGLSVLDAGNSKVINLFGTAVDMSETGIGIKTDYPLEPGHILRLINSTTHKVGLVIWSRNTGNNEEFRAGVKFM